MPDDGQGALASFSPGQFPGLDHSFTQDHTSLFGGDPFGLKTETGEETPTQDPFAGINRSSPQAGSSLFDGDPFGIKSGIDDATQPADISASISLLDQPIANIDPHQFGTSDFGISPTSPIQSSIEDNIIALSPQMLYLI